MYSCNTVVVRGVLIRNGCELNRLFLLLMLLLMCLLALNVCGHARGRWWGEMQPVGLAECRTLYVRAFSFYLPPFVCWRAASRCIPLQMSSRDPQLREMCNVQCLAQRKCNGLPGAVCLGG